MEVTDPTAKLIGAIAPALVALAGFFVALAGYRLAKRQREDLWVRTFAELHKEFWNEYPYGIVRAWLACDASYEALRPTLQKRRDAPTTLTQDEYAALEKLDKFLNLLSRAAHVSPALQKEGNLWTVLFFDYWLKECQKPERTALRWYLERFYENLQSRAALLAGPQNTPR